jgi:hypothetical protein
MQNGYQTSVKDTQHRTHHHFHFECNIQNSSQLEHLADDYLNRIHCLSARLSTAFLFRGRRVTLV